MSNNAQQLPLVGKWFIHPKRTNHDPFMGEVIGETDGLYVVRVPRYAHYDTASYVHPEEFKKQRAQDFEGVAWFDSLQELHGHDELFHAVYIFPEIPFEQIRLEKLQEEDEPPWEAELLESLMYTPLKCRKPNRMN